MYGQIATVFCLAAQVYGYQQRRQKANDNGYRLSIDVLKSIPQPLAELLSRHIGLHNYGKRTVSTSNYGTKATWTPNDHPNYGGEPLDWTSDPVSLGYKLGYALALVYPNVASDVGESLENKIKEFQRAGKRDCICQGQTDSGRGVIGTHSHRVSHLNAPIGGKIGLQKRLFSNKVQRQMADTVSYVETVKSEADIESGTPHLGNGQISKSKTKPLISNVLHLMQVLNSFTISRFKK
ncbi:unnamed protein product [Owenia fusiformis]|uniref:Uncharacterized protein n=1 Tax=Owenia fusiformis TaxID=6347 RepID=A0A8J1U2Q6_OWEFU|nr:unnamed protein product [Owenia fusiformis]